MKLLWRSAGHSGGGLGKSESDSTDLETAYETRMELAVVRPLPQGQGAAAGAGLLLPHRLDPVRRRRRAGRRLAPSYPAAADTRFFLSGADALVADAEARRGRRRADGSSAAPPTPAAASSTRRTDPAGTSVSYTTAPLTAPRRGRRPQGHASRRRADLRRRADPALKLVLFAKLYDVAPDGTATLNRNQISAARVGDPSKPVTIELPGIVHRFAKGPPAAADPRDELGDLPRELGAGPVTSSTRRRAGVLTLPHLGSPAGAVGSGPDGTTPFAAAGRARKRRPAARLPKRACARVLRFVWVRTHLRVARVKVNGKRVKTVRGRKLRKRINLRLPSGKTRIVVTARSKSGVKRRLGALLQLLGREAPVGGLGERAVLAALADGEDGAVAAGRWHALLAQRAHVGPVPARDR